MSSASCVLHPLHVHSHGIASVLGVHMRESGMSTKLPQNMEAGSLPQFAHAHRSKGVRGCASLCEVGVDAETAAPGVAPLGVPPVAAGASVICSGALAIFGSCTLPVGRAGQFCLEVRVSGFVRAFAGDDIA